MPRKKTKKQQIIQAAIEVFGKKNFREAGISEIARLAGVADGTIYEYFKSKQHLFFSIPLERTKVFCQQLNRHLEDSKDTPDKIRRLIWYYLYFFKINPDYARSLMLEMRVNKDFAKSRSSKSFSPFMKALIEILEQGQKEGGVRRDLPARLLRQVLLGSLEYVVTRWLLKGEKYDLLRDYEEMSEAILGGIGDHAGGRVPGQEDLPR
jgi:TetR/AcrR family fatty acid metabolism transcriptional regulator